MASEGYHEPYDQLSSMTRDIHRALTSLIEELEAVDWYNQRVEACQDKDLRAILAHNRDEEKEHAAMVLEWVRRRDPQFDRVLRTYLFTASAITELEDTQKEHSAGPGNAPPEKATPAPSQPRLTVGSLLGENP